MTEFLSVSDGVVTWNLSAFLRLITDALVVAIGVSFLLFCLWFGGFFILRYLRALMFWIRLRRLDGGGE